MKGFPAWPAMISEPEKWGLSSVKKKLLVYFYGTKQIAFCNYTDLEAFTEEKRKSLLAKRHGKGADFVRAVKEIVEIYDSLKNENNNKSDTSGTDVKPDVEDAAHNSNSDRGGREEGSDLVNDNKLDSRPTFSMDHNVTSSPVSNIPAVESGRCVVNSAPDEPSSSFSKKSQNDVQQNNSCTLVNLTSPRKLRSSLGADLRPIEDSCGPMNSINQPCVDVISDNKQVHSFQHKCIGDNKPNSDYLPAREDSSQGTCSKPGDSTVVVDDESLNSIANIQDIHHIEASKTEVKQNGTIDSMSTTVTFKRKRKPHTNHINNPSISVAPKADEELQTKSSGNLADSPNSGNELNKSDGDEHLPLVKRARVRMGRALLEDSIVDECVISDNKTELATHENRCDKHDLYAGLGKDHSADMPPSMDPSSKVDLIMPSGDAQTACKNKEYHPKVLSLDGEAALPPSKRLHRALEAMSANATETISSPLEVQKSEPILKVKGCAAAGASSPSNKSLDAIAKVSRSVMTKTPTISSSGHSLDTPDGEKHILLKDLPSTIPLDLKNACSQNSLKERVVEELHMDDKNIPLTVCSRADNDVCGKARTYSMESKASGNESMEPTGDPAHDFAKNVNGSAEPVSQANVVPSSNGNCNSVPHDDTHLAKPTVNVSDRTSASSLVTKISCIQSDASSQTFEPHGSSAIALKEHNHRMYPKGKSLSPDVMPMKELIAAAHTRRFSQSNSFIDSFLCSNGVPEPSVNIPSLKEGSGGQCSPSNTIRFATDRIHTQQNSSAIPFDNMQQKGLNKLSGHDEASSARRAFEAFLGSLTRTKESIGRATRLALECDKQGIAGEVLKLWLERKTLSEYIIRHHIKELQALNEASFGTSRRPSGTERALNDPLRDNEGMLVDEYGSNTGFHLPNLIGTKLLEDEEGSSSEERSFEAVTPEHEATGANEQEASQIHGAKHRLVLEEVDGDHEMEDLAPSSEAEGEAISSCQPDLTVVRCATTKQNVDSVPPLPDDRPPSPPPLPSSPPPLPRPPCPVFQDSQVQGALAADQVQPDPPRTSYNVQEQHPHSVANNRSNMDPCIVSSHPPAPYNCGYAAHANQMPLPPPPLPPPPPVAPFHPPGPHFSGPSVPPHHGNNYHQPPSVPPPNNAYHLQPPPHPPFPNQYPYVPPEPQQSTQPWNCNSSYPERHQYGEHDRGPHAYDRRHHFHHRGHHFDDGGHYFDDGAHHFDDRGHPFDDRGNYFDDRGHHFDERAVRGQMHHEVVDRGRFPPHFPPGNHRILHQGQALGGQCLLGDLSTLLALDTRWTIQFPMKEVGGGMEDTIMINTLDDWEQRSFLPHLPQNCC
uniref:PWWP domain-containing protein n=1 Tax=Oryza punctata TaxID=4537 RepID=A0A0E0LP74_ORYPU